MQIPYRIPIIEIRDKHDGSIHAYGTDSHDALMINEGGYITYHNLQNGDGTSSSDLSGYEFVDHSDYGGYGAIKEIYLEHRNQSKKYDDMSRAELIFQCLTKDAQIREMLERGDSICS